MWSFYADCHKGCCVEVEIEDDILSEVEYIDDPITIDTHEIDELNTPQMIKAILTKKFKDWGFEKEIRVLTNNHYVPVTVKRILFGMRVNDNSYEQLKQDIQNCNREIEVFKMDITMFNHIDTTEIINR